MSADGILSVLRALCDDAASARMLLGNPVFLQICAALAEQIDERFQQTVLLEKAARHPGGFERLDGSRFREDLYRGLEHDYQTIRLLRDIDKFGGSFCEESVPVGGERPVDRGNRKRRSDAWRADTPDLVMQLIVAGEDEALDAARDLKRWLRDAQVVAICDPYIMHFSLGPKRKSSTLFKSTDDYVQFISNLLPATARHVKLYGNGYTGKIKTAIRRKLKAGRTLDFFYTNDIHDRYIIKNNAEGRMLGTSFGGFVSKIFTILPLPREDTQRILAFLRLIELKLSIPQLKK
jgi:hypothetical protein